MTKRTKELKVMVTDETFENLQRASRMTNIPVSTHAAIGTTEYAARFAKESGSAAVPSQTAAQPPKET